MNIIVMSKARPAGNKEKNGTQRDVNSSLPEVGLTYSPSIYFIYIIYKCRCFAHDSTVTGRYMLVTWFGVTSL